MTKLIDLSLRQFVEETASGKPAPGGGSIAALSAALSVALTSMTANLTIGRKGYEQQQGKMKELVERANRLQAKSLEDIDRDSDAYAQVVNAYQLPNNTDEEKSIRDASIQEALKEAARVPLAIAKSAFKMIDLAALAVKEGNRNAITDGTVAAMMARTAVLAALFNVKINLGGIRDVHFIESSIQEIQRLEAEINEKEKEILSFVDTLLTESFQVISK